MTHRLRLNCDYATLCNGKYVRLDFQNDGRQRQHG